MKNLLFPLLIIGCLFACREDVTNPDGIVPDNLEIITDQHRLLSGDYKGFVLSREEAGMASWLIVDREAELTALISPDAEDWCAGDLRMSTARDAHRSGQTGISDILFVKAARIDIYRGIPQKSLCDYSAGAELLASGRLAVDHTSPNPIEYHPPEPGLIQIFGFQSVGKLQDEANGPVDFQLRYTGIWDGTDISGSFRDRAVIQLN